MFRGGPEQMLDLNWNQRVEPTGGRLVNTSADSVAFHKLVGGELASGDAASRPRSRPVGVRLNSPTKLNRFLHHPQAGVGGLPLSGIPVPAAHLEQRFSDGRTYGHLPAQFRLPERRMEASAEGRLQLENNGELMCGRAESSVSDPSASGEAGLGAPAKKRKAAKKGKVKLAEEEDTSPKRSRSTELKPKVEKNEGKSSNSKSPEPPKDYIHVRARRGQATDSHSLAERVRREKISQRMKLLQDLVPGCNKVTGKAVMLDEIINYVQSLQCQVEFLSMKLATVNPQLDFNNVASCLPKDMHQACGTMPNSVYSMETSEVPAPYINQPPQADPMHCVLPNGMETQSSIDMLDLAYHHNLSTHHPFISGFESASSQLGAFWEDDLQNVTHMDTGHD
ncbi:transcription factor bHLH77-like [Zingiber officinale]|uniref:BHLH domain-containing protein n=1 Tax=Zingiber officinale TaxID=94328 RepID=A0A8J5LXD0_ZINOF|nr:transcription factor bHLH77-like [Zingiber officinale]KAG6539223.1 hypothetical protein ZIOFF_004378 [Zingiber officinale]